VPEVLSVSYVRYSPTLVRDVHKKGPPGRMGRKAVLQDQDCTRKDRRSIPMKARPDPLRVWGRITPSFGYYGEYKLMFVVGKHPQTRISIGVTRCMVPGRGQVGFAGDFGRIGPWLCRILDMNFREFRILRRFVNKAVRTRKEGKTAI
jgi:hypothetical protein